MDGPDSRRYRIQGMISGQLQQTHGMDIRHTNFHNTPNTYWDTPYTTIIYCLAIKILFIY